MEKEIPTPVNFYKDRLVMGLVGLSTILTLANMVAVVARLRSNTFKVPIQYNTLDGSIIQASWYQLYGLAIFSLVCGALTLVAAHRLYKGSRWFSVGVLIIYCLISVISFITINALLSFVARI